MVGEQRRASAEQLVRLGLDGDPLPFAARLATIRAGLLQLQGHDDEPLGGSMVAAGPFRGLRFDPAVVGDPGAVIVPPYDVITPEARDAYEAMNPYNVVRLILARDGRDDSSRYEQAAKLLESWRDEGALLLDPVPSLYLYEEAYAIRGERRVQRGVMANVTLDDTREVILPHEGTMVAPVADRLRLLEATRANLSPIYGLYAGGGRAAAAIEHVTEAAPAVDAIDEAGLGHRLWPISDPATIARWSELLADQKVLIADGHHRYRTALAYRDEMDRAGAGGGRGSGAGGSPSAAPGAPGSGAASASDGAAPWHQTLMLLVDIDQQGPSVLPVHRLLAGVPAEVVLARLQEDFQIGPAASPSELEAQLEREPRQRVAFGLYGGGQTRLLVARDSQALRSRTGLDHTPLDVEVLHRTVLEGMLGLRDLEHQVAYSNDLAAACRQVDQGEFATVVALRPAPFSGVLEVAQRGRILPPKTTFFYPKPRDGLVLRPLHPEAFAAPSRR
jgi:uncharacterized protein (DUF1015 family)